MRDCFFSFTLFFENCPRHDTYCLCLIMGILRRKSSSFFALQKPFFDVKLGLNFTFTLHRLYAELARLRDSRLEGR